MNNKNIFKGLLIFWLILLGFNFALASDYFNKEAEKLLYEGGDFELAGDFDRAIEVYEKVIKQYPGTNAAELAKKDIDFIKTRRAENEDALRIYIKAAKAWRQKKYNEVISICTGLNKKYPEASIVLDSVSLIGCSYREMKQYDKAIEVYQEMINKYPGSEKAILAQHAMAMIYEYHKHDYDKAIKAYKEYMRNIPKEDSRSIQLAKSAIENIYYEQKRYDLLKGRWIKELKKDPTGPRATYYHSRLINMYWELKEYDNLVKQCEWILKDLSDNEVMCAVALNNLGFYYKVMVGNKKKAYEYYNRLIKEFPDTHWAKMMKPDYEDLKDELISFPEAKKDFKQLAQLLQDYYKKNKEFPEEIKNAIPSKQINLLEDPYNPGHNYKYFFIGEKSTRLVGKRLEILIAPEKIELIREKK